MARSEPALLTPPALLHSQVAELVDATLGKRLGTSGLVIRPWES